MEASVAVVALNDVHNRGGAMAGKVAVHKAALWEKPVALAEARIAEEGLRGLKARART
ncbi:hypothetical protein [Antarctobacter jejuensis]|uniref:hypothetical protein n=1 Tax=Antarctobacter jejuensis TaxID=1439938 RepID=UPI003FD32798